MVYKYNIVEAKDNYKAANDTYNDILSRYAKVDREGAKNKLANDIRSEFIILGEKTKHLVALMDLFSVDGYKSTVEEIISIDREMSRKLAGLAKINIFPLKENLES